MWCESKNQYVQKGFKIVASEEVKQFASMVVIILILYRLLADYQFKIEHKRGAENILADALSLLNLPNDEEENMEYVKNHKLRGSRIRPGCRENRIW